MVGGFLRREPAVLGALLGAGAGYGASLLFFALPLMLVIWFALFLGMWVSPILVVIEGLLWIRKGDRPRLVAWAALFFGGTIVVLAIVSMFVNAMQVPGWQVMLPMWMAMLAWRLWWSSPRLAEGGIGLIAAWVATVPFLAFVHKHTLAEEALVLAVAVGLLIIVHWFPLRRSTRWVLAVHVLLFTGFTALWLEGNPWIIAVAVPVVGGLYALVVVRIRSMLPSRASQVVALVG